MSDHDNSIEELETLFAAARQAKERPSDEVIAAIMVDAAAVQSRAKDSAAKDRPLPGITRGFYTLAQQFANAIGGWPAFGGLVTAGIAGLWVGLFPPSFLPDPVAQYYEITNENDVLAYNELDPAAWLGDEVEQ